MKFLIFLSAVLCACAALPSHRIVGGFDAKNGSAPYQASLRDSNYNHFCGASILNKRWLLTAAHCISGRLEHVYMGSNHVNDGGRYYDVEKSVVHEDYAGAITTYSNDIALVKVTKDIVFNEAVQTIKLHREYVKGGEELRATGWGLTQRGTQVLPEKLQELKVKALSNDDCYKKTGAENVKPTTQVCTLLSKDHGVCNGDSGGPLVLNGEQVGLASFVLGDCALGFPDFFTRVSLYVDWVEKHIKN